MPYEVIQLTRDAIRRAQRRVIITTRIPSRERLTENLISEIKGAALRGVSISIYLTGKVPSIEVSNRRWNPIRELDRLTKSVARMEVNFVVELKRSIFEVVVDEETLLICNRPPLGDGSNAGAGFHPFAGYLISDPLAVRAYVSSHLSGDALQVAKRIASKVALPSSARVSRGESPRSRKGLAGRYLKRPTNK
jgi:phosphatidylserine/phosphatidylglycerophosphate/cardiolipin synthase-like enzyme